jgi:hypothetical protein
MADKDTDKTRTRDDKTREDTGVLPGHVMMNVTAGPYAGMRIQMPEAVASEAESEGWAYPLGENPLDRPEVVEQTPEERDEMVRKAEDAGVKLRGEDVDKHRELRRRQKDETAGDNETEAAARKTSRKNLESEREQTQSYSTRDVRTRK